MNSKAPYLATALTASLLNFSYYTADNLLNASDPARTKVQLLALLFADQLTLASLLVLGSALRPSKVWPILGALYLLYCALDSTTLRCFDSHVGAGLQFARMLVDNPESLQWVGGFGTIAHIGKTFCGFLAIFLLAAAAASFLRLQFRWRSLLAANVTAWLITGLVSARLWTLSGDHLFLPSLLPRTPMAAMGPLRDSTERFREVWARCAENPPHPKALPLSRTPDIVLIVGESWNASVVEELSSELRPYFKKALRSGHHFSGSNSSTFGLFALLGGRESCFFWGDLDKQYPIFLPAALKKSGYRTTFWGCAGYWPLDGEVRFLRQAGFDSIEMGPSNEFAGIPERDRELFARLGQLLKKKQSQPQFVTLFTGSTHYPYYYPPEWDLDRPSRTDSPLDRPTSRRRYRNSVRFSLHCLAGLLDEIDFSNTIVIVTGDHGESMGEDTGFGHSTRASQAQFCTNFWLWAPSLAGQQIPLSSHVDLAPTLVHLLTGGKQDLPGLQGYDLLQDQPRRWAFSTTFGRPDQAEYCALYRGEKALIFKVNPTFGQGPQLKGGCDAQARDLRISPEDQWPAEVDALSQFWHQPNLYLQPKKHLHFPKEIVHSPPKEHRIR